jgi:hypothetical protein
LTRVACHVPTAGYRQHQQTGCRESGQSVGFSGWKQTDPIAADDPASKRHRVMSGQRSMATGRSSLNKQAVRPGRTGLSPGREPGASSRAKLLGGAPGFVEKQRSHPGLLFVSLATVVRAFQVLGDVVRSRVTFV